MTEMKRILPVDNVIRMTRLPTLNLQRTNIYLVRVERAEVSALAAAELVHADPNLLDVLMPNQKGGEFTGWFRNCPQLKDVLLVLLATVARKAEKDSRG